MLKSIFGTIVGILSISWCNHYITDIKTLIAFTSVSLLLGLVAYSLSCIIIDIFYGICGVFSKKSENQDYNDDDEDEESNEDDERDTSTYYSYTESHHCDNYDASLRSINEAKLFRYRELTRFRKGL
jgi:hypothetical protein